MKEKNCPLCGCGELEESTIPGWYKCSECEEVFFLNEEGSFEVVTFEEWKAVIESK